MGGGNEVRIEFLMCGNPTDAFLSQGAIVRRQLDRLGGDYARARLVFCFGVSEPGPIPERWVPHYENIEVHWADTEEFRRDGNGAQGYKLFQLLDPMADISMICDADTLVLNPFPTAFFDEMRSSPAICGAIGHYPPPLSHDGPAIAELPSDDLGLWSLLADRILGRPIAMRHAYSLLRPLRPCPFYINHGVVAGPPALLAALFEEMRDIIPRIRSVLDNDFCDQLGITLGIERRGLPCRPLPMRYNFPNDPIADELYQEELANVVVMHYLRTDHFDRHRIFHKETEFAHFMRAPLSGSNAIFREYVRQLTGGQFPFP